MLNLLPQKMSQPIFLASGKFFLMLVAPLAVLLLATTYFEYRLERLYWKSEQKQEISTIKVDMNSYFYESLSDLLVLADHHDLFSQTTAANRQLAAHFARFAEITQSYHQLRFIDNNGMELVRVNYNDGVVEEVAKSKLQDKSNRPYFQQGIKLNKGEVFISRFDLNIEHGKIEYPLRPVIRFATPVFDNHERKVGIIVLNYLGEKLLYKLKLHDKKIMKLIYC